MRSILFTVVLTALIISIEANRPLRPSIELQKRQMAKARHFQRVRRHGQCSSNSTKNSQTSVNLQPAVDVAAASSVTQDVSSTAQDLNVVKPHRNRVHTTTATVGSSKPSETNINNASTPSGGGTGSTGSGANGQSCTGGDITYYATGLGACGITSNDQQLVCAVSHELYDTFEGGYPDGNPNNAPVCGRHILLDIPNSTETIDLVVVDRCGGCDIDCSLDLSPAAFAKYGDINVGRYHNATWRWGS